MFTPAVIESAEREMVRLHGDQIPGGQLVRSSIATCHAMIEQLADAVKVDRRGTPVEMLRPLTAAEAAFIQHERWITGLDFRYWAERYAIIAKEAQDAAPIFPLWASQQLLLDRIAALEADRHARHHPDGILLNVLKARQLGVSTLTQVICAHRVTTQTAVRALVAADVEDQSRYLFSMAELIIERLPWWLRPTVRAHQTGDLIHFDTDSTYRTAWGKSSRGGLQDAGKTKGNIGRGKTFGVVHISEYSTWERPEQIRDGLLPGVPARPRTFFVNESTAKGRHDPWHEEWTLADRQVGRFTNVFIPWYIEKDKYWLPPHEGWEPLDSTKAHCEMVERTSAKYLLGKTHRLTASQAYWYERTRETFAEKDELNRFLEEYPATPEEAFQHAGKSIFGSSVLERCKGQERLPQLFAVEPAKDIAQLRAWERAQV